MILQALHPAFVGEARVWKKIRYHKSGTPLNTVYGQLPAFPPGQLLLLPALIVSNLVILSYACSGKYGAVEGRSCSHQCCMHATDHRDWHGRNSSDELLEAGIGKLATELCNV